MSTSRWTKHHGRPRLVIDSGAKDASGMRCRLNKDALSALGITVADRRNITFYFTEHRCLIALDDSGIYRLTSGTFKTSPLTDAGWELKPSTSYPCKVEKFQGANALVVSKKRAAAQEGK